MDKETENWIRKQMFYEEHGEKTFYQAKRLWLIENKYYKSNWIKRLWLKFQVENNGNLIMEEVKPIQNRLIKQLMELNATPTKPNT